MTILTMTYFLLQSASYLSLWPYLLLAVVLFVLIAVLIQNRVVRRRVNDSIASATSTYEMMEKALKIVDNDVVFYDIPGKVIRRLRGNLLSTPEMRAEEFAPHIHPDDVEQVLSTVRQMAQGKTQQVEYSYRWRVSEAGEEPRYFYIRNNSVAEYAPGSSTPTSIISVLVDETEQREHQEEEEELAKRYKKIFEDSIIGLSFYSPEGWLLDANKMMRQICHFDSDEGDAYFSKMNLFDMAPFNEVLDRYHPNEYLACSLSVVPEREMYIYLEIGVHPIYDEEGKLIYISVAARDINEERELYMQAKRNDVEIQKVNESIQVYERELRYMMETCGLQAWRISLDRDIIEFYSGLKEVQRHFTLKQLQSIFYSQEDEFVRNLDHPAEVISKPLSYMGRMHPMVTQRDVEPQWVQINSIPEYDEHGNLKGAFGVWRNIHQLMQKQEQLKRETERANDSGRMKSVFMANMTHEIRTPLNAIVGFSDVLPLLTTPEERQEIIRLIIDNCDMLLRLVNDIQDAASLDVSGSVDIAPTRTDFSKFFDELCEQLQQRLREPTVEFMKENPYPTYITMVDEMRIRQVYTNFVTNAVKYTHQGHIKVGYRKEWREENGESREGLFLFCEDTGDGVPKEVQDKLFERFFKLNDYIQGTGLGLSICKAIANACQGFIGMESEGQGQGSTFWMWIPCNEIKA
ncbi:MAG: PAS domain-containing sensor histidine kinase [Prevotella sp.]|nr:PAS domain-containing sensor histidine kinase [Prevotella sp.]